MKLNVLKVAVALTVFALLLTACGGPTLKVLSKDEAKGYYDQLMAVKDSEPFAIIIITIQTTALKVVFVINKIKGNSLMFQLLNAAVLTPPA